MKSQRKSDEDVIEDWASVHGRLLPWSDDETTTHDASAHLRYLKRQPTSNEAASSHFDETLELLDDDDVLAEDDVPCARARGGSTWLWSSAAGSGLIAAVLFGRVLLAGGGDVHAAASNSTSAPAPQLPLPPPSAASAPPALAAIPAPMATPQPQPELAFEVSHPASPSHSHTYSYSHVRVEAPAHVAHEQPSHVERGASVEAPPLAAPATLRINSRPWSQVFIDNRLIGNTPQLGIGLPAGSHEVRLVNQELGMTKSFSLRVRAGESITRVETLEE